jgi:predicted nucleic acid-binding protein
MNPGTTSACGLGSRRLSKKTALPYVNGLMTTCIVLDTGPLGRIAHPRPNEEIVRWLRRVVGSGALVIIPEIADYELRRNMLLEGMVSSLKRLDELKGLLFYMPLTTRAMRKAAEFWAEARKQGKPRGAPEALDGDAILAAQAFEAGAVIASENVAHLSWFVEARHWREIE